MKKRTHYFVYFLSTLMLVTFCSMSLLTHPALSANIDKGKILFVLSSHEEKGSTGETTGYYLSEAAHPWDILTAHGYTIDFVSPKGGNPPVDGFDLNDPINKRFWEDKNIKPS